MLATLESRSCGPSFEELLHAGDTTVVILKTLDFSPLSEFSVVDMGLRPTRAAMKMSYGGAVAPERTKVASANGTGESGSSLTAEA